jgi:glycosyltransferase involved in cell wall biosynthesis
MHRIAYFNFSSSSGGSSSVANLLVKVLEKKFSILNYSVIGNSHYNFFFNKFLHRLDNLISIILFSTYRNVSVNCIPTTNAFFVNKIDCEILHFHWIHFNFFSFWDLHKIKKPIVWTLHDAWVINYFGHLSDVETYLFPHFTNYLHNAKISCIQKSNIDFVCPSKWLYEKIRKTNLFKENKIHQIYNPIDLDFWINSNYNKRNYIDLNTSEINIIFVSNEMIDNKNKGFPMLLLISELAKNSNIFITFHIVCPNNSKTINNDFENFIYYGKLDKFNLRELYCKVDFLILPSIIENLPTVLIESISCSTPVIAFNTGGVVEIVEHGHNGLIVNSYSPKEFLESIIFLKNSLSTFKANCRDSVSKKFSYDSAFESYSNLYKFILHDINSNCC